MARRKDHSPEQLTLWVISSVIDFLQRQPASDLSLRKIAKMVEYSPGTLINLFGSYSHLILAVNAHTLDEITERIEKRLQDSQALSQQQQLIQFALEYLNFAQQHPHQWRILFEHRLEDEVPQWQQDRINQLFLLIENRLIALAPNVSMVESQKVSRTIWASVHGICMLEIDDKLFSPNSLNGHSMIESLISHYLDSWLGSVSSRPQMKDNNQPVNNKNHKGA